MKQSIKDMVAQALSKAFQAGDLTSDDFPDITVDEPRIEAQGDLSVNTAMVMAKNQKMSPRKIADIILKHLDDPQSIVEKTDIAGPGFINFFMHPKAYHPVVHTVHEQNERYGASDMGTGIRTQVEFVSANPTGPLHVGHGRGAAVGDSVARILRFCGYDVQTEYYINDSGRQINTLGRSVYLRYLEKTGQTLTFPDDCYKGDYIVDLADQILARDGRALLDMSDEEGINICARFAADSILADIAEDLKNFGVTFDQWFSEQSLYDDGKVQEAMERLKSNKTVYENDGAFWFNTTAFGDEKDRVVVRSNGQTTYFASDIAYHQNKFARGFNQIIDVWGADHHGYIPRMKACISASGHDSNDFHVILVQLVSLLRDGKPVAMTTRGGVFETLKDVVDEVGSDAARFIFLSRHYESQLEFDLELAKKKTNDNPVFYVQYVHARISSILKKAADEKNIHTFERNDEAVSLLLESEETGLIKALARYPEVIETAGKNLEPHRITYYLMNLSSLFHAYYNKHKVLTDDPLLTTGRLYLILAVQKVIKNGLSLLGVSAPEHM
ncbi:MAG: arginine--tRNA ligase [Proteobacteria bacterium]|nr:arginine--tRNA ligase [Pseudomonadota bacterium]